jgi:hypothetical protein
MYVCVVRIGSAYKERNEFICVCVRVCALLGDTCILVLNLNVH